MLRPRYPIACRTCGVHKVGGGSEFGEHLKSRCVILPQMFHRGSRFLTGCFAKHLFEARLPIRPSGQDRIEPLLANARLAGGRKTVTGRDQHIDQPRKRCPSS